jgi:hypothetical protein
MLPLRLHIIMAPIALLPSLERDPSSGFLLQLPCIGGGFPALWGARVKKGPVKPFRSLVKGILNCLT